MNKRFLPFLLAAFTLHLGGCITIEENYAFKKDGSGTMTYVLDMRQMAEMLKSFGDDGKEQGDAGDMGKMSIGAQAETLKGIAGISKVKLDTKTEWVQSLSFAFTDIDALNRALNALMPDSADVQHTFFRKEGNALVRTSNSYVHQLAGAMLSEGAMGEGGEDDDGTGFDLNAMLGMMKYKYSFKFKQPVETAEASSALVKEDTGSKEVKYSTDWAAIAKDPKSLDLRIGLKGK